MHLVKTKPKKQKQKTRMVLWFVEHYFWHWEAHLCLPSWRLGYKAVLVQVLLCYNVILLYACMTWSNLWFWWHVRWCLLYILRQCRKRWDEAQELAAAVVTGLGYASAKLSPLQINPLISYSSFCIPVSPRNHWTGNLFLPCYWCHNDSTITRCILAVVGHFWFSRGYFHGSLRQHGKRGILEPSINTYIQINTGSSRSQ